MDGGVPLTIVSLLTFCVKSSSIVASRGKPLMSVSRTMTANFCWCLVASEGAAVGSLLPPSKYCVRLVTSDVHTRKESAPSASSPPPLPPPFLFVVVTTASPSSTRNSSTKRACVIGSRFFHITRWRCHTLRISPVMSSRLDARRRHSAACRFSVESLLDAM